jgi:phage terminase large subunit-like protein
MSGAEEYARWVLDPRNDKETGRLIKLAAQRFLNDLKRDDIYFDEEEAVKMINFGERYCYQWEGDWEGLPVKFELWQRFLFEQIYGWIRRDTGTRRFNRFYLQVAKKNGKSTMCAVLSLYHLFADDRVKTPKVFTAANNEDQAKICVNMAGRIVEASPDLYDYVDDGNVKLSTYGINITEVIHKEKNGFIKAFSKESGDKKAKTAGGKHGVNASLGLVDEFGMSADYGASGSIETSMASRSEWLMAFFTTAGFNMNGPCYTELRAQGIEVLEGAAKIDNYLPMIFEIDPPVKPDGKKGEITAKWLLDHPEVWRQPNPNLGISVNKEFLKSQVERAILRRGEVEVECKTLNFDLWCEAAEVWIPQEIWSRNSHGIDEKELLGKHCFGGIDLASAQAFNAVALYFPNVRPGINAVKLWFWIPSNKVKENKEKKDYTEWVERGLIDTTPGDIIDFEYIYQKIKEKFPLYQHVSTAYDRFLMSHGLIQRCITDGLEMHEIGQGFASISTPTKEWERLLTAGEIEHFNNPVLEWMNKNTSIIRDANRNIKIQQIDGEKGHLRIDGIAACINAVAESMSVPIDTDQLIESW